MKRWSRFFSLLNHFTSFRSIFYPKFIYSFTYILFTWVKLVKMLLVPQNCKIILVVYILPNITIPILDFSLLLSVKLLFVIFFALFLVLVIFFIVIALSAGRAITIMRPIQKISYENYEPLQCTKQYNKLSKDIKSESYAFVKLKEFNK